MSPKFILLHKGVRRDFNISFWTWIPIPRNNYSSIRIMNPGKCLFPQNNYSYRRIMNPGKCLFPRNNYSYRRITNPGKWLFYNGELIFRLWWLFIAHIWPLHSEQVILGKYVEFGNRAQVTRKELDYWYDTYIST